MAVTNYTGLQISNPQVGIQITKVTDSSADWGSVANSTYFYDKATALVYFKDSTGTVLNLFSSAGGLVFFTEAQNTSTPNTTVPVDSLTPVSSATNTDVAIVTKGSGAFMLRIPDNTGAGGNKRGAYAVDLSISPSFGAYNVASADYSAVLGGVHNQASGTFSVTAGYYNTASGYSSNIGGGTQNNATGSHASVSGGAYNSASSKGSVAGGNSNTASGFASFVGGGYGNVSSGNYSHSIGTYNNASGDTSGTFGTGNIANSTRSYAFGVNANVFSMQNRQSYSSGQFASEGDNQMSRFLMKIATTDNTPTSLTTNGGGYSNGTNNYILLSNQSAFRFKGTIVGKQSGSTNASVWDVDGFIVRGASAGATTLVVSNVNLVSNAPAWGTPTLSADTTIGCLNIQVTGASATNIRWMGNIETTEVIYA